jgi:hypothetical protein
MKTSEIKELTTKEIVEKIQVGKRKFSSPPFKPCSFSIG